MLEKIMLIILGVMGLGLLAFIYCACVLSSKCNGYRASRSRSDEDERIS